MGKCKQCEASGGHYKQAQHQHKWGSTHWKVQDRAPLFHKQVRIHAVQRLEAENGIGPSLACRYSISSQPHHKDSGPAL